VTASKSCNILSQRLQLTFVPLKADLAQIALDLTLPSSFYCLADDVYNYGDSSTLWWPAANRKYIVISKGAYAKKMEEKAAPGYTMIMLMASPPRSLPPQKHSHVHTQDNYRFFPLFLLFQRLSATHTFPPTITIYVLVSSIYASLSATKLHTDS